MAEEQLAVREHLGRVSAHVDVFGVLQEHLARLVEQERNALRKGGALSACPVVHGKVFVFVVPDFKLKAFVFGPALQGAWRVEAYANNLYIQCLKLSVEVAVPATLDRSAIGPGRWEKPQDRSDTLQVVRAACAAIAVGGGELGTRNGVLGGDTVEGCHVARIDRIAAVLHLIVGVRSRTVLGIGVTSVIAAGTTQPEETQKKRGKSQLKILQWTGS